MIQSFFTSLLHKKAFVVFLYIIISAFVFSNWIWSADTLYTSFNGDPDSKLSDLIYGTAHKPYVNRALVPFITRTIHNIVPADSWESLEQWLLGIPKVEKEMIRLGWEREFLAEYLIALSVAFLAIAAFPFVVRNLWIHFYETNENINNFVPIAVLLTLPTLFRSGPHYIYDFPALLLFTLGLLLLLKRRWIFFYVTFIIGCFNKETMIFLTPIYLFLFIKYDPPLKLITHATLQVICFIVTKLIITFTFSDNPGTIVIFHIFSNIGILLQDYPGIFLLSLSIIIGLVIYDFHKKPEQLRQCFLLVFLFVIFMFCFGIITELRAAYEIVPIVLFLILHTILFCILKLPYSIKSFDK